MSLRTFTTRDGSAWVPQYIMSISDELCIGCGRCYKVCTQGVLELKGINEDGELCDPFDDSEDIERKVMIVSKEGACVGCGSCETVCGTKAQKHEPMAA